MLVYTCQALVYLNLNTNLDPYMRHGPEVVHTRVAETVSSLNRLHQQVYERQALGF